MLKSTDSLLAFLYRHQALAKAILLMSGLLLLYPLLIDRCIFELIILQSFLSRLLYFTQIHTSND